ncbi:MAG: hypothetical protein HYX34_14310 [Actinobacteria bacterium]|nr:hypothetical protein [Actinomycetota bacterium]
MSIQAGLRRRFDGTYPVDEWGLDRDLVELMSPLVGLRWATDARGVEHLSADGPAVLVFNRRFGLSEPFVLARGVRLAADRPVRFVGAPDIAPVGPALRRFGAVLGSHAEVAGLLRAGHLVGIPLERAVRHRHKAGRLPVEALAAALDAAAPVVPVALVGREVTRRWVVAVGEPLSPSGQGPLAEVELAEAVRRAVQDLLDEALPAPRWPL